MFKNFLRQTSIYLSALQFRKTKFNQEKHFKIEKKILNQLSKFYKKNPRLRTHKNLSNEILNIFKKKQLKNFLRNQIIQNVFFIHNRFFIFYELRELKKDKKWSLWKKLLNENDIGNPVRYFLYSESSGNRIRQVYLIKKFLDSDKSIDIKNINKIIELGGGYGCMADIFKRINKNNSYTIYDMFEVNFLQYYYLKMNNHNPVLNIFNTKLNLINSISNLKKFEKKNKDYLFIANWSISEFPLNFRKKFISTILNSKYSLISFQENFEGINNLKFFKKILKKTNNKYFYKIEPLNHYNNALFNNNKHYILSIIKK